MRRVPWHRVMESHSFRCLNFPTSLGSGLFKLDEHLGNPFDTLVEFLVSFGRFRDGNAVTYDLAWFRAVVDDRIAKVFVILLDRRVAAVALCK